MNDSMGDYVAKQVVKIMIRKGINIKDAEVLILGITFKENCPDVRNTKIIDVVNSLKDYGVKIAIFDPWANIEEVKHEYSLQITNTLPNSKFDAIVLGVSHKEFLNINLASLAKETSVIYDVKGILDDSLVDGKL
jgi:UDP-N-acetyl-D-galactosamine dehydrogenase